MQHFTSKQLLNDIVFILFTDKNLFALATMKNSHNNQLYLSVATKKKHIRAKCCLHLSHQNDVQSFADDVLKFDYIDFILLDPESKSMRSLIVACLHCNNCCLTYIRSLISSEAVPQCTGHARLLTLIFCKVV